MSQAIDYIVMFPKKQFNQEKDLVSVAKKHFDPNDFITSFMEFKNKYPDTAIIWCEENWFYSLGMDPYQLTVSQMMELLVDDHINLLKGAGMKTVEKEQYISVPLRFLRSTTNDSLYWT